MISEDVMETEIELVSRAQTAVSQCNWVVGECASKWTRKYARGRTDGDFGLLVGLSADQVYQRRRVWETFADVSSSYSSLKWSHFYVALTWDDAPECLQWASENEATVAEMKAWRRAVHGEEPAEDATVGSDWGGGVEFVTSDLRPVRDPEEFASGEGGGERSRTPADELSATMAGFAREAGGESSGAAPPWEGDDEAAAGMRAAERPASHSDGPSVEQLIKRMTATLNKISRAITPEFAESFHELPSRVKDSFRSAVEEFRDKLADLGE